MISATSLWMQANCTGGTTFTFTFPVITPTVEIVAIYTDASGGTHALAYNTDFTLSAPNQNYSLGGTLTLLLTGFFAASPYNGSAPNTGTMTIYNAPQFIQNTHFIEGGAFPAQTTENIVDRLTIIALYLKQLLGNQLQFPLTDPAGLNYTLPYVALRALQQLTFDAQGQPVMTAPSSASINSAWQSYLASANVINSIFQSALASGTITSLLNLLVGTKLEPLLAAGLQRNIVSTSGALGTLTVSVDTTYYLTAASTATLPASPQQGCRLTFKNVGNFTSTISGTIGTTGSTSFSLYAEEDYVTFEWNVGTSIWYVVATNGPLLSSNQTASTSTSTGSAWAAIGNGLSLGTVQPGVYDLEIACTIVLGVASNLSIALGNGTSPISETIGAQQGIAAYPLKITLKNYVLTSAATIQGLYYSNNVGNSIAYASPTFVGKITARRIG